MITFIVIFLLVTAAIAISAWLLIRQFRRPQMTAERAALKAITEQAERDISQVMNSSAPRSMRQRSAVEMLEGIITRINAVEQQYQRRLAAGEIPTDQRLVGEIRFVRECMQNARAKLQFELNKDED